MNAKTDSPSSPSIPAPIPAKPRHGILRRLIGAIGKRFLAEGEPRTVVTGNLKAILRNSADSALKVSLCSRS